MKPALGFLGPLLALALIRTTPAAADDVERLSGEVPGEMQLFQDTLERYRQRVAEIQADALASVLAQKAAQSSAVQAEFDARIDALSQSRRDERDEAMQRFEGFLNRYDDHAYSSEVRLRLAELSFQRAQDEWLERSERYFTDIEAAASDLDRLAALEEQGEPQLDLSQVVSLLQRIIEDNRSLPVAERYGLLDVAYYMLAFVYAGENTAQYDREKARDTFVELIRVRPDSEYADAAHLILGTYAFSENRLQDSIPEFQAVLDRGPERKHYQGAMYQLAWARYKINQYDEAMRLFVQILDDSERGKQEGRKASPYERDATTYLALSLSDRADQRDEAPLVQANRYFQSLPGAARPYEWAVLKELAESLVRYARPVEAAQIYEHLQVRPEFRLRPENIDFQAEVVRLLSRGYDADLKAAGEARIRMTQRYSEGSEWWNANRDQPEALAKARKYIETSLLEVAIEVKVRAQESKDPAIFSLAADKYREYLEKFPISDGYFDNQFQLADSLYQANRFEDAAKEYADLLRNERLHSYGDISAYMLFRTRDQLMRDRVGPPDQHFEKAEVERTYTSVGSVEMTVFALDDTQQAFIESADQVLTRPFAPDGGEIDIAAIVNENRVKIMYLPAQILFYANRFEQARPRLQEIITRFPETDEAAWAANLLLNSYIVENDSAQIRRWSREFATLRLGATSQVVESRTKQFQDTLEKATFEVGLQAGQAGDFQKAADSYMAFVQEFPDSENVPVALLNAAGNFDKLGRVADANAIYERFIKEYPTHPEAKPYFFIIASNYESTFELEKAIGIYQELVDRFPDYERAPDAQYMVGFLKEGLGDKAGAAQAYETYAKKYPTASDKEDVVFRAGALYGSIDPDRAVRFYRSYLATYGTSNPDHAIAAQYQIAMLSKKLGRTKEASAALDEVVELFARLAADGATVGPLARDQAAEAAFRPLLTLHDRVLAYQLTRNEKKDATLLTETIRADVNRLQTEAVAFADRYRSFEYSTAALFLVGSSQASYARLGLSVEPPASLDDIDRDAYWEALETTFFPLFYQLEDQAVSTLKSVIQLGKDAGRHGPWVDKAQELLNRLRPEDYPAGKQTLRGKVDASPPPEILPLSDKLPPTSGGMP